MSIKQQNQSKPYQLDKPKINPIYWTYYSVANKSKYLQDPFRWFTYLIFALIYILFKNLPYSMSITFTDSDVPGVYFNVRQGVYSSIDDSNTLLDNNYINDCVIKKGDCKNRWFENKSKFTAYMRGDFISFCIPSLEYTFKAFGAGLPRNNSCPFGGAVLQKHIAGVPGDKLIKTDLGIYINGKLIQNSKLPNSFNESQSVLVKNKVYIIPDGYYYISGKNPRSFDSRYYGFVWQGFILDKSYLLLRF